MNSHDIGKIGEDAVAIYIDKIGCSIIKRNFRTRNGEIDVIFRDGDIVVFGEVKTRRSNSYGMPCESVDLKKRNKIINVARQFFSVLGYSSQKIRFDVFEVYFNEKKIRHIKNAYSL
ncbi:YraN family protein [Peptostreptococcus faecalis]|uniref:YraN family protein n=1 Tax=Peptostreptococcus faecalis TaxID=2045015 RepID=UPI000C7D4D4F|nr:YraN family protein [Peptostreptococcus faecalis]